VSLSTVEGVLIGVVLLVVTLPLATRAGRLDRSPRTTTLVRWGLVLKLLAAPVYLWVIGSVYKSGDYAIYHQTGVQVAHAFRSGNFTVHVNPSAGRVGIFTGWVYTLTGVTELGAFFIFSWIAFLGQYLFYRAFRMALPDGDRVRYGRLIFLFPSVLFWTAMIGKDALIFFGLGLASNGVARLLMRRRWGFLALAPGTWIILLIRPHVSLIVLIAGGCAYFLGRPPRSKRFGGPAKVVGVIALLVMVSIVVPRVEHFLGIKNLGVNSVNKELTTVSQNTTNAGSQSYGTQSSSNTPVKDPLVFPRAFVTVMFRPFPWEAPSTVTLAASLESLFLLGLTVTSARRIFLALARVRRYAYSAYALVYTVVFVATFASIGNYGILARERVQTLPLFFILLAATPRQRRARTTYPYDRRALPARPPVVLPE
jgi:hypothetical protein